MGAATLGEPLLHGGGGARDGGRGFAYDSSMVERPEGQAGSVLFSNRNSHPFTERQADQQMDGEWDWMYVCQCS